MGIAFIKQENENQWVLKEVMHVPDLKKNLISIGQLGGEGYVTTFTDKTWKQKNEKKVFTLYLCNGISNFVNALTYTGENTTLWYHRFGHMSQKGMQNIQSRNLLLGLKHVDLKFCENCVYGKQKRVRFLRVGKENKSKKLELVHIDVWGHAQVSSLDGSRYYVILLMMQPKKHGFIVFEINLMYLIL